MVTISGSASDGDGTVELVEIRIDGSQWHSVAGTTQWEYEWDTSVYPDGEHTLEVQAQDNDGFYSDISSIAPTVDNSPPEILSGPATTSVTDSSATVQWETDEPADSFVEYGTDTGYGNPIAQSTLVIQHNVVLKNLSPSTTYHYRVKTTDALGNTQDASGDRTFTTQSPADKTPPEVTISNINELDVLTGDVQVNVYASDDSGIDRVEFYINSQQKFTDTTTSYTWLWETTNGQYPDGIYTIRIIAIDNSGNDAVYEITVELDNELIPPSIIRIKADPNSVDNGESNDVLVTVEVSDPGNALEAVVIDLSSIGRSPFQNMYDDGTHGDELPGDGIHTYEVRVPAGIEEGEKSLSVALFYDGDKSIESSVDLVVISSTQEEPLEDKGSDTSLDSNMIWLFMVIVLIIATAIAIVGLSASKKRKQRQIIQVAEPVFVYQTQWK
jgi:hypothetical protein